MTDRRIILTVIGDNPYLIGYSAFSAQQVRRFEPERGPGHRCLVGPFARQPAMNVPTALSLHPDTMSVVVSGRAYDPACDAFIPLVHAPGHHVHVPLAAPQTPPVDTLERFTRLVNQVPWVDAVTYRDTFPHEYSRRAAWANDADFVWACETIARYGFRNWFNGGWWVQLDCDGQTHWTGYARPSSHFWINRRPLDRPAVPISGRQAVVAENAALLDVPMLPAGWRNLPAALTTDPRFRLGVGLFGLPEEAP